MSDPTTLRGIRNTTWEVHRAQPLPWPIFPEAPSGVRALFRGRDGLRFSWFQPIDDELIADAEAGHVSGAALLGIVWREFRWQLDRRYDDPFAFWPRGLGCGRWA